jgi:urease accessory protein
MYTNPTTSRTVLFAIAMLLPMSVCAHTGPGAHDGLAMGLMHPVTGLDHLLALLAVGLWAAQMPRICLPRILALTSIALLGGAMMGMSGIGLPMVEPGIALSVVLFGVLVIAGGRLPFSAAMSIVGLFAVLHGHAHGTELPAYASGYAFIAGFLAASLALILLGYVVARQTALHRRYALPAGGATIAMLGAWMAVAS